MHTLLALSCDVFNSSCYINADYSGDMSGSMGMRPGTYTQQSSTGGYPGGQGGASGQYGKLFHLIVCMCIILYVCVYTYTKGL